MVRSFRNLFRMNNGNTINQLKGLAREIKSDVDEALEMEKGFLCFDSKDHEDQRRSDIERSMVSFLVDGD